MTSILQVEDIVLAAFNCAGVGYVTPQTGTWSKAQMTEIGSQNALKIISELFLSPRKC